MTVGLNQKPSAKKTAQRYVWDIFVRIFHWSLVTAFAVAFYYHQSEWDRLTHVNAGYTVAALLIARIVWGFMKTGYANFRSFPPDPPRAVEYVQEVMHGRARRFMGHNPAGSIVIYAMLLCGLVTVTSGYLVYNDGWLISNSHYAKLVHHYAAWTWLLLVALHIVGVVTESLLHHDNLIKAMITGCKRVSLPAEKNLRHGNGRK